MTNRSEIEEGRAWAARALNKPEPGATPKTLAERRAVWLRQQADERAADAKPEIHAEQRGAPEVYAGALITTMREGRPYQYRAHIGASGTAFAIGATRTAADGTQWRRTA